MFKCSNVQTSKQRVKNLAVDRGPLAAGAPSHGTAGTMDNPALNLYRHTLAYIIIGLNETNTEEVRNFLKVILAYRNMYNVDV